MAFLKRGRGVSEKGAHERRGKANTHAVQGRMDNRGAAGSKGGSKTGKGKQDGF
ncbi:hypothetical protein M493_14915 [Geobacillus genomosp. 3]|uniref:Uncharacterized protein n=1 Tax=Geobacillus genomosp. 3 TaxID=1921421 RepID=S5ZFT7_GEOG3|nr:hypothetical protein M493_14915 [Geobacillus genomosp. 3]